MKRSGGDRFGSGSKRTRMDSYEEALANGKYELRLVVTSRGAGGIIGRGGENIKRLRSEVLNLGNFHFENSHFRHSIIYIIESIDRNSFA